MHLARPTSATGNRRSRERSARWADRYCAPPSGRESTAGWDSDSWLSARTFPPQDLREWAAL